MAEPIDRRLQPLRDRNQRLLHPLLPLARPAVPVAQAAHHSVLRQLTERNGLDLLELWVWLVR